MKDSLCGTFFTANLPVLESQWGYRQGAAKHHGYTVRAAQ